MASPASFESIYPELFAPLTAERRISVARALDDDRLEHGEVSRQQVELVIRGITENMTDTEYTAAVLQLVNQPRAR